MIQIHTAPHGSPRGKGCIVNLSQGGAGVESEIPLDKGQLIFFKFLIPMDIQARITYVKPEGKRYRYGLQFKNLGLLDRLQLRRYLRRRLGS